MKMFKKIIFSVILFIGLPNIHAQTVYEWYQDGIVVFQMKTDTDVKIPVRNKEVDISRVDFVSKLKDKYGIYEMIQMHPNDPDILLRHTYQLKFDNQNDVENLIRELSSNNSIAYAEKKELHKHFLTPNDLGANSTSGTGMWHLYRMSAPQAWDLSTGDASIVVAVTDDAILTTHEDLQNKLVQGFDAPTGGTNPNPCGSNNGNHGTHVSGTVGAQTNNGIGVASIGFNISVMPIKIGNCNGALTHGYEGINYAANNGADVVNMSWGGGGFSNYGQNVCNAAYNAGTILVAAAGNDGTNQQFYPAAYNNVIAVASTTTNDAKSGFSQYGTWITVSAPGSAIRSTYATSNTAYARIQGTSMASPNVAGLLGLMKSYVPTASNTDLINCLLSSADNIDAANPSYIGQLGSGRINAFEALQCIGLFNVALDAGITSIVSPENVVCGNSFVPQVTLRNFGTNTINSVAINYEWNGTPAVFNWTGTLTQGQTTIVSLPNQVAPNGSYTFTASTSNPNGNADQNPSNDASQVAFVVDENGQSVDFSLSLDCYGSEISWAINDDLGNSLYTGGGYSDNVGGQLINSSFCLPVGCYTFAINDTYGDGLYGSQWQNCAINGNYSITDENGNVLVQMTAPNADFGFGTTHQFCVVAPNNMNDAGISNIISPNGINCSNNITPIVELRNYGNDPLTSVTINYQTTGGVQTFAWIGSLTTGQSENVTLPSIVTGGGLVSLTAYTSDPNGQTDDNATNDESSVTLNVYTSIVTLPFIEDFETNVFATGRWSLVNPDNDVTWELATVGGITPGTTAAKIDFFNYATAAQRDGLVSPRISLAGYNSAEMTFDHAYRRYNQNAADSLVIYVSSDCGVTWQRVFAAAENGTGSFATQTTNTAAFTPAIADDWCFAGGVGATCFTVNLNAFIGQEIFVKFESYNAGTIGNNLYIDNINIDGVPNEAPPIPNFTSNTTSICANGSVQFTDLSTANITSWSWSFPGGIPATSTDQNPVVTYPTAGTYNVELTVTNSFGTETIFMANEITVNNLPIVGVSATSLEICAGTSTQLSASGANAYTWDNGLGAGANKTVSPTTTTTYTVTGSNGLGCEVSESITINVIASPTVTATANQTIVCAGDIVELSAGGASNYSWNNGLGAGATQTVSPTVSTIYTVTGTNGANCSSTANVTITVNAFPVVTINASVLTICEGTTVALAASGATSYSWTPTTGLSAGTGAAINASPTTTTTYTVEGTNNCGTDTEDVTIFVNPNPTTPVIAQNGNDLSVNLSAGETAQWYFNGVLVGNGPVITMSGNGLYEVVVTNNADCSAAASGNFEMDTTSIDEINLASSIVVFPNPTSGLFTVSMNGIGEVKVWLTDAIGRRLTTTQSLSGSTLEIHYDISSFETGVYMIVFESELGIFTRKVTLR
jgi:PKD repeat protein